MNKPKTLYLHCSTCNIMVSKPGDNYIGISCFTTEGHIIDQDNYSTLAIFHAILKKD